jgi:hypothetical protein
MDWGWSRAAGRVEMQPAARAPRGFAAIAEEYFDRFRRPIMLSETNVRGSIAERLSWLKLMEEQAEEVVLAGHDFRGFCWYPSLDTTDWANGCTRLTRTVDPQGIWTLDSSRIRRHASELSDLYGRLARGEITSRDLPAYRFGSDLSRRLRGYQPFMRAWDWVDAA